MGPKSNDKYPYKRRAREGRRGEGHVTAQAEIRVRQPCRHQGLLTAEASNRFFSTAPEEGSLANILISDFWPPVGRGYISVVLSHQMCGTLQGQPGETEQGSRELVDKS